MEYLVGNKQIFLDYLNKLEEKDRVGIITHTDLDGVASALLINEILKFKKLKIKSLKFTEVGNGKLENIKKLFAKKKINKVFVFDISVGSDYKGFEELRNKFDVFLVDHHPYEIKGNNIIKTKTADCATFTIYDSAKKDFDLSKLDWLVCATMISEWSFKDENNFNFLKEHYPEIKLETINDSEPGETAKRISSAMIYFKGKEKKVYDLILKNRMKGFSKYQKIIDEEIKTLVEKFREGAKFYPEKNIYFYVSNSKYSITSVVTTILSIEQPKKTFVFVSDIKNEPDFYKVSSRNNGGEDMNLLMRKGITGLENASGGGHVPAAAARFMKKDLDKFKENLLKC